MRILGVDPGSRRTGWGIVDRAGPGRVSGVAAGVLELGSRPLPARLRILYEGLTEVIVAHQPTTIAVEDIFYAKHANAAMKLGHARGVALLVAAMAELEVHAYPPALVKKTVAGRGAADKHQVAMLVGTILRWKELPGLDATDALAIAITHAQAGPLRAQLLEGSRGRRKRR